MMMLMNRVMQTQREPLLCFLPIYDDDSQWFPSLAIMSVPSESAPRKR